MRALAAAIKGKQLRDIRGVPTSKQSERRAIELGIPLTTLAEHPRPNVTIDGADEVAPNLDLIKGLGGALLREKIVAQNSAKLVIIADANKTVHKLGSRSMLPVEVAQFAHEVQEPFLRSMGAPAGVAPAHPPATRLSRTTAITFTTADSPRESPRHMSWSMRCDRAPGIVETGLFLGIASVALIANEANVEERFAAAASH